MKPESPLTLGPSRTGVVRLNRRIIYIVGALLVGATLTGLIAIRAQDMRARQDDEPRRPAPEARTEPWFQGVPDQEPARAAVALDPLSSPPTLVSPPKAAPAPAVEEPEAQRRQRALRAAISAPIGVAAFERGVAEAAGRHRAAGDAVGPTREADRRLAESPSGIAGASGDSSPARMDSAGAGLPPEYLRASVREPVSPYEVQAGTIIPAVMLGAINSDLTGQILGQVRENVYDSVTGAHLLIPQGTRLVGLYDHRIVYGQERVLITWKRLILPSGSSLSLGDGMPGTDALGAAGFHDEVNNHYVRIFGNALLLSVISAGLQLSQIPEFGQDFRGPTAGNVLGAAVGQQFGSAAAESIRRGMGVAPTLEIRPGYPFTVIVTQDVVFPGPYQEARQG
jgi:type IV secretion system protein TrbI